MPNCFVILWDNYRLIEEKWTQSSWFSFEFLQADHFAPSYASRIITLGDGKYLHFYKGVRFSYKEESDDTHLMLDNIYDGIQRDTKFVCKPTSLFVFFP